jgi:SAM-dependent methyltransferase
MPRPDRDANASPAAGTPRAPRRSTHTAHADDAVLLRDEDWYDHPKWYDVLHWPGTMAECHGLVRIARRFSTPAAGQPDAPLHVFEPACGTGRHLRGLASLGHTGVGIDIAKPMLDYGNRLITSRNGDTALIHADMTTFSRADVLPPKASGFDLAFCLANSVRHLDSDDELAEHLRAVARVLKPGAVYALGIGLTIYGAEDESEDIWRGARGQLAVTQMVQYLPADAADRRERVISQLAVTRPGPDAYLEHSYTLRSYDGREFAAALDHAGIDVVAITDEDGEYLPFPDDPDAWRDAAWMGYGVFILRPRRPNTPRR